MKSRPQKNSSWLRFLAPGLLLLIISAAAMRSPYYVRDLLSSLLPLFVILFFLRKGFEKSKSQAGNAQNQRPNRIPNPTPQPQPVSRDNRPLSPVTTESVQPHSHSEKSAYDPRTGSYNFRDIQRCVCPNCGFVTDTSHRFCSRCDLDLTKPHVLPRNPLKRKDDFTW